MRPKPSWSTSTRCRSVVKPAEAARAGAPQIYDEAPNNIALDFHFGDAEKVKEAFAKAPRMSRASRLVNSRVVVNAMEPRSAVAEYDKASGRYTLHTESQGVMGMKGQLVDILKTTPDKVHVLTGNVGGSFGMKAAVYPEYVCILHAARELGRPVKWTDERSTSFMSDNHGRDHVQTVELALDEERSFPGAAADRLRQSRRLHGDDGAAAADAQHRAQCRQPLSHAADRGERPRSCSPTPRISIPIAAPDARRAITTWSG